MTIRASREAGCSRRVIPFSVGRVLLALVLVGASSSKAAAQSSEDAVAKITQMNRDAVTAYQAKKFDDARKILKQALDLAESNGLDQHPITARTHIHMGVVIIGGFKQRDLGIKQFKKALEIEPTINLTKALVTPEMTEAFNEAKSGGGAGGGATPPPSEPPAEQPETPSEPPAPSTRQPPRPRPRTAGRG